MPSSVYTTLGTPIPIAVVLCSFNLSIKEKTSSKTSSSVPLLFMRCDFISEISLPDITAPRILVAPRSIPIIFLIPY